MRVIRKGKKTHCLGDYLEHLHQCSVCDPALEILDEVHQSSEFTGNAEKSLPSLQSPGKSL